MGLQLAVLIWDSKRETGDNKDFKGSARTRLKDYFNGHLDEAKLKEESTKTGRGEGQLVAMVAPLRTNPKDKELVYRLLHKMRITKRRRFSYAHRNALI